MSPKLIIIFIILLVVAIFIHQSLSIEPFQPYQINSNSNSSSFPKTESSLLVQDQFPRFQNQISNLNSQDIWWHRPIFQVGSYEQITNNIRYPNNPDVGSCTPASMCQILYKPIHNKSNIM
jgi:hypothetical protein